MRSENDVSAMALAAFDGLARDESLQGSLTARGYVPLLEWASDMAQRLAACIGPEVDTGSGVAMVSSFLRRLVQAAVWAAETGSADGLKAELGSCPASVIDREIFAAAVSHLQLDGPADSNAEAIAGALRAAAPWGEAR